MKYGIQTSPLDHFLFRINIFFAVELWEVLHIAPQILNFKTFHL